MPQAEFEPAIPSSERTHIPALDRAATGIGFIMRLLPLPYAVCKHHTALCRLCIPSADVSLVAT